MSNFYTKDHFPQCTIGDYTYGIPQIIHWGEGAKLEIGKFCSIAGGVLIFLGGNHRGDWITTYPFSALTSEWPEAKKIIGHPATKGDVRIGSDVWIGNNATILSGVTIGHGAIIGTHAVVTKDVPSYAIVVGNPAKIVKYRFDESIIEDLLTIKWWDWDIDRIKENISYMCNDNISEFLRKNR